MNLNSNSSMIDRVLRNGLATPALALTVLAGAAFAQQGGMGGRTYEVVIETPGQQAEKQERRVRAGTVKRAAPEQEAQNSRVVIEINRIVDGQTISVRQVNDEPITVKIDGNVIGRDHYQVKDGQVIITDPATGRKHEVNMPRTGNAFGGGANPFMGRVEVVEPAAPLPGRARAGGWTQDMQAVAPAGQPRVMLGVVMAEPDPVILEQLGLSAEKTVVLERVIEGLPAAKAGLQAKDIVIGFGDHAEPRSAEDIRKVLSKAEPGSTVKVKVIRKGEPHTVDLKLEAFDGEALARASVPQRLGGNVQMGEAVGPQRWAVLEREQHDHMAQAEKALRQAAEMMARMERDLAGNAADAHRKASEAIKQAIEAMQQGDLAGMEIEEMRQLQQEAVERLRRELADNRGGQRLWAQPGEGGQGFALRFPDQGEPDNAWAERLEQLERRLGDLERNVDRAIERLEARTGAMMERLINRLEESIDRLERDRP